MSKPPYDLAAAMEAELRDHGPKGAASHETMSDCALEEDENKDPSPVAPSRIGKKRVQGYFSARVKRQLRVLAAELDATEEELVARALNLLFEKSGLPAIAFDDKPRGRSGG